MDSPAFTFDPDTHTYRLGDQVLPSVSEIIKPLQDYAMISKKVMEHARQKGEALHLAVQLHNEDDLDISSLDTTIVPRFEAWLKFLKDTGFKVMGFEERLYSKLYRYAGTPDLWGEMNGEIVLPDTKPPTMWTWYPVQLSCVLRSSISGSTAILKVVRRTSEPALYRVFLLVPGMVP